MLINVLFLGSVLRVHELLEHDGTLHHAEGSYRRAQELSWVKLGIKLQVCRISSGVMGIVRLKTTKPYRGRGKHLLKHSKNSWKFLMVSKLALFGNRSFGDVRLLIKEERCVTQNFLLLKSNGVHVTYTGMVG